MDAQRQSPGQRPEALPQARHEPRRLARESRGSFAPAVSEGARREAS
jgi:hypothetical protein